MVPHEGEACTVTVESLKNSYIWAYTLTFDLDEHAPPNENDTSIRSEISLRSLRACFGKMKWFI